MGITGTLMQDCISKCSCLRLDTKYTQVSICLFVIVSSVLSWWLWHYSDIIMSMMASEITSLMIVYSTIYLGANQRKHQSSASLAFVRGIHRWLVISLHKGPVMWKMFPFDDVIMDTFIHTFRVHKYHWENCMIIPLVQKSWRVVFWFPLVLSVCPSVRPSVRPSVCGQNRVCSVSSTILAKSISYLHILSSNFRRCVVCKVYIKRL